MRVVIEPNPEEAARFAAHRVAELVSRKADCVLALAAGSTMIPVYREVARLHQRERVSFARARAFDLDEYAGLASNDPRSFVCFLREHLIEQVDFRAENHFAPDAHAVDLDAECTRYEAAIVSAGGLDLAVLGLGRNGHLAFNEPGASLAGRTRVEVLMRPHITEDGDPDPLPRVAITMGLGTILAARGCLVVAFGAEKERSAAEMIEGPVTSLVPASVLQHHPNTTVVLDDAAAALLVNAAHYREVETLRREMEKNARG
ncbi:MAG: glucosamine-6-phosphate deaminase [Proteobacteria bacterium]|nr:glucosamine-6-phosphate deaminase [Pseudomonadota bacterium]